MPQVDVGVGHGDEVGVGARASTRRLLDGDGVEAIQTLHNMLWEDDGPVTSGLTTEFVVVFAILLLLLGLAVGSFLNVLIHRVPSGASVVRPGSACPGCGRMITARDNIPVLSWTLLKGRCRSCGARISARYPAIEILNGALWVLLGWWALATNHLALLPWLLVLTSAGIALTIIDLGHHRLPNVLVYPLYPLLVVGLLVAGLGSGSAPVVPALIGAGVWLVLIGGIWLISGGRGMGMGDVKVAPILGATLGWLSVGAAVVGLLVAFLAGAVVGVALMAAGRASRKTAVPFGPFLFIGTLVGLLAGEPLVRGYVNLALGG